MALTKIARAVARCLQTEAVLDAAIARTPLKVAQTAAELRAEAELALASRRDSAAYQRLLTLEAVSVDDALLRIGEIARRELAEPADMRVIAADAALVQAAVATASTSRPIGEGR